MTSKFPSPLLRVFPILGILVSLYALWVEHRKALDDTYEALCDLSEGASCTKVLMSSYGHIFSHFGLVPNGSALDVPNPVLGLCFYSLVLLWPWNYTRLPVLVASLGSVLFSAYLGYILYAVLKDFCLVCVSSYIINVVILVVEVFSTTSVSRERSSKVSSNVRGPRAPSSKQKL
jgi:vitamin-K-epoxide reductase (warfarin-sensitive)